MSFHLFLLRRLLFVIPTLLGITLVAFLIANAVPADPVTASLPANALNNEEMIAAFRAKWGLDKPLHEQYLTYLGNLLHGDMGTSIKTRKPVADDLRTFFPATFELATAGIFFGIVIGITVGVIAAVFPNSIFDYIGRVFALMGVSIPVFLLALIGLQIFYAQLGWVAGPGRLGVRIPDPPTFTGLFTLDSLLAGRWDIFRDAVAHLTLPALVLGVYVSGIIARITRSSLLEVLGMDYIRTARSKGLREPRVILRHGLANAMIPVVTVIGLSYSTLLSGAVLTESIFAWPGIGRYMFRASTSQDLPAIMGGSILIATIYVGVNFVVDILYYFLDPRIRAS
ncbi:MAG TPA: ABC transporter permease [Phototrophicaceae bacterium]|jgi:peptide/nickel transport system permease protein|nr:ABC transporter permease [Phototrophicaceae bacterium]